MPRLLLVFLLLLLPLQAVWSAALPYCQHESGSQSRHLGHHAHRQHASDNATQALAALNDADCLAHQAPHALPPEQQHSAPPRLCAERSAEPLLHLPSPPQPRPERPNWAQA